MSRVGVAEFIKKVCQLKKRDEKVAALKFNDSFVLRTILQGVYDNRIKWLLPEGEVPYTPNKLQDQENVLIRDARLLKHFVDGGTPGLNRMKREMMFIEMLENVSAADAELLVAIKDKKLPWKGLNADIVKDAFPGLLPEDNTIKSNEQNQT